MSMRKYFSAIILITLLIFGCNSTIIKDNSDTSTPTPETPLSKTLTPTITISQPYGLLPSIADIVEKVRSSVVYISVEYIDTSFFWRTKSTKTGSGVILGPDGYILTNNHVISEADKIEVVIPDNENIYTAELISADPTSDLAVIKIDDHDLSFATFGDTSQLRVGDWVIALGNALGLEGGPSVTLGIVSNLERSFPQDEIGGSASFYDVIQTDADINQGNSGGPLVDLQGNVVGINTFVISSSVETAGFAISANTAQRVYEDLIEHGHVIRPYLGIWMQTVTPALASEKELYVKRGVLVAGIAEGSPADKVDIQVNDVIVTFDGEQVDEAYELTELLWQHNIGDTIELSFWRGIDKRTISIVLGDRPGES